MQWSHYTSPRLGLTFTHAHSKVPVEWQPWTAETLTPGYAMLMSPNQDETAVHGCHSTGTLLCASVKVRPSRGDV